MPSPARGRVAISPPPEPSPPALGLEDILGPEAPLAATEKTLPPDLERVLGDVDQSLTFGFVDEAREALRSVESRYPGHPAIRQKIEHLGLERDVGEAPSEVAPLDLDTWAPPEVGYGLLEESGGLGRLGAPEIAAPVDEPESFDLGAELDDLFSAQPAVQIPTAGAPPTELGDPALAQIFEEFKKGVDQQLGKEDYDTRYNLGIAYKEMGLVDEAIAEFQLAAKDDRRLLECSSMLGLCFMEKGMPKLAVKWFEKGLKAPGRLDEEYQGLRYDLAAAHEAAGDLDPALRIYSDIFAQDASFRDVGAKLREIRRVLGR
jgi:tetratricopeptide (TPR) repeat protein